MVRFVPRPGQTLSFASHELSHDDQLWLYPMPAAAGAGMCAMSRRPRLRPSLRGS